MHSITCAQTLDTGITLPTQSLAGRDVSYEIELGCDDHEKMGDAQEPLKSVMKTDGEEIVSYDRKLYLVSQS